MRSKAIFGDCYVNDKMLHSVLPCNYAIAVVRYINDTYGGKYHKSRVQCLSSSHRS